MEKKKILVVDDEDDLVSTLKLMLEASNYEVITASNGQDGLNMAHHEEPDLIILDLMLPKLDGYHVSRLLKFDMKYKKIPIIMLTARVGDEDRELGFKTGADVYMTKPFEPADLLNKIKELLK